MLLRSDYCRCHINVGNGEIGIYPIAHAAEGAEVVLHGDRGEMRG